MVNLQLHRRQRIKQRPDRRQRIGRTFKRFEAVGRLGLADTSKAQDLPEETNEKTPKPILKSLTFKRNLKDIDLTRKDFNIKKMFVGPIQLDFLDLLKLVHSEGINDPISSKHYLVYSIID